MSETSAFKDFAEKRCEEISDNLISEGWYVEAQGRLITIRSSICEQLSENSKELLDQYDKLCLHISCKTNDRIYEAAYKDGISRP